MAPSTALRTSPAGGLRYSVLASLLAGIGAALWLWWTKRRLSQKLRISKLLLFPIKSAAPVEVKELHLDSHGFRHDRRWAVLDERKEVVTLRNAPRLVLVRPEVSSSPSVTLTLSAPGMSLLKVATPTGGTDLVNFSLWDCPGVAQDCGDEAARWLTEFLRLEVRLAYFPDEAPGVKWREMCKQAAWNDGDEAKSIYYPGSSVGFADSTQGTLVSQASLDDLSRRLRSKAGNDRFRMNVVLEGAKAFEEDTWTSFGIGELQFDMSRRCNRCAVTLVDPKKGERGPQKGEPLKELRAYRSWQQIDHGDPRHKDAPLLGMKFGTSAHSGTIAVGDEVRPLSFWKPGDRKY